MRILVIGAGAVGGYFGARLQAAGRDVTFLVRERRAEQLRRMGLQVISPYGDVTVQPQLLLANELLEKPETFELILLSTKAYSLHAAMEDFAPAVDENTAILPLLNGMRHLDVLDERFGAERVLGGSTRIVADLDGDGRVLNMERLHDLVFGERDRSVTPRVEAIATTLHGAGFDDMQSPDVLAFMWQKWVLLCSLGSSTCFMRGTIGEIAAAPGGTDVVKELIAETSSVAAAEGYPQTKEFLETITARLTKANSPLTASMYRDLQKGSPVEAEQIVGDMLRRAERHGIAAPLLKATFANLGVYMGKLA